MNPGNLFREPEPSSWRQFAALLLLVLLGGLPLAVRLIFGLT
jgi:hypothetical protein